MTETQQARVLSLINADNGVIGFPTLARAMPYLSEAERNFALFTIAEDYSAYAD